MNIAQRISVALVAAAFLPALASAFPINISIPTSIYEYVNDITGHYLMLNDSAEIAFVKAGNAGPGWHRTGYVFGAYSVSGSNVPGSRLCRFYAPAVNSHFYTARDFECQGLRNDPKSGWIFERNDVSVLMPVNGTCAANQFPVYRLYNNRAQFLDTNHRHTPDLAVRDAMVARGWIDEGVAFCTEAFATPASTVDVFRASFNSRPVGRPPEECENPGSNMGSCLEVENLASMTTSIPRQIPPRFSQANPDFPLGVDAVVGWTANVGCVNTALPAGDPNAIVRDSFIESVCMSTIPLGIHVNGANRLAGDVASINPDYQLNLVAPASFQTDVRVMPWTDTLAHNLDLSFQIKVQTLRAIGAGDHAAGTAMLRFRDQTTSHEIVVAVQAYGTNLQPDSVGYDDALGAVKITTAFAAIPLVGQRVSGEYIGCPEPGCVHSLNTFKFRISREDFVSVLAVARDIDPRLSPKPGDYMVSNFQLRNETFGDGELGVGFGFLSLTTTTLAIDLPP